MARRPSRRPGLPAPRRAVPLLLLLLGTLAATAGPAQGHALPVDSSPASGDVVPVPPAEVVVRMSERLEPSFSRLQVLDGPGQVVSEPSTVDPDQVTMRAALPRDLPYGTYTVSWKALSQVDGHSTRGLIPFLFPDPSKPLDLSQLPSTEVQQETLIHPLDPVLRAIGFAGVFAAAGAAVLLLGVAGPRDAARMPAPTQRRLGAFAAGTAATGALATVALAGINAGTAAETGALAALAQPGLAFGSGFGLLAGVRVALLLGAAACAAGGARLGAARREGLALWACAGALAIVAVATSSLSSHAAALPERAAAAQVVDALHFAFAAAWVGGLAGLGWVLTRDPGAEDALPLARIASRFSLLATVAVVVVVATGVLSSVLEVKRPSALLGTDYGLVLLVKVGLVAALVALGAMNRFRVLPALAGAAGAVRDAMHGPRDALSTLVPDEGTRRVREAWRRLGRLARAEAALGVAVLLATGALTSLSPPAPDAGAATGSAAPAVYEDWKVQEGVNVTLLISPAPPRAGYATLDVFLYDAETGLSLNGTRQATFTFTPPDPTLGRQTEEAAQPHPAHYAVEGGFFAMPGEWTVRVSVRREAAFDVVVDFEVPVEPAAG